MLRRVAWCVFLGVACAAGGHKKPATQPGNRADAALEQVLKAWVHGGPADKFASGPIRGTDPDWQAGQKLVTFLTAETTPAPDDPQHLRCKVSLTLQARGGPKSDKDVFYDVQL